MQKLILSLILISLAFPAFGGDKDTPKFPNQKGAVLIEELKAGKVYGSLEKITKEKSKAFRLIGHASFDTPKDKLLAGNKFVLIGWLGVQKIDEPFKVVMFKEPIVSSFVVKNDLDAIGVSLPTFGEMAFLNEAIENLEANHIDPKDFKKKNVIKAPSGQNSAQVLPAKGNPSNVLAQNAPHSNPEDSESGSGSEFKTENAEGLNLNPSKGNAKTRTFENAQGNNPHSERGNTSSNAHNRARTENNNGHNPFNFSMGSNDPLVNFGGRSQFDANQRRTAPEARNNAPNIHVPEITFEHTEEGCPPEHDALQERVTIMGRMQKSEDGRVIDPGICEKTLETYEVKRDYLCEGCQDEINTEEKKAYARYMEYWIKGQQRHNLGIKLDRGAPFEFFENTETCGFNTEAEEGFAIQTSRLGYLNKFRTFKVVENCRVIENSEKFPIQETTRGCEIIHDFVNKGSFEQKRSFFTVNGAEHKLVDCHPVEPVMPHQFSTLGCPPIINIDTKTKTDTARRRIMTTTGLKVISEECEPTDNHLLTVTRGGCEGQYTHEFVAMKSYLKKRYYFPRGYNLREYVTGCIRTDDFIVQKTESNGRYEHNDVAKTSIPYLSLYIDGDKGRVNLEPAKIRGQMGQVAYNFVRNEHRPTNEIYYEGCFRRTKTQSIDIYKRGDNSVYEQIMGAGNVIASTQDECTSRHERTAEATRNGQGFGPLYWSERTVYVNPKGTIVSATVWVENSRRNPWQQDFDNGSGNDHHSSSGW